jgi:phosphate starvation-inducible protein PhoH
MSSKRHLVVTNDHFNDNWQKERDDSVAQLQAKMNRDKLKAIRPGHHRYIQALLNSVITVCSAPAGTGKTFMACGVASQLLRENKVERIIITRPLVQCKGKGKSDGLGYLPGDVNEKTGPYMRPVMDAFGEFFSALELGKLIQQKKIEIIPLELLRGSSLKKTFVICDEAQNCTLDQLRMLLTRLDSDARIVVVGDASQSDLHEGGPNALMEVVRRFTPKCHRDISIVTMDRSDVCRPEIINWMDSRLSDDNLESEEDWQSVKCPKCKSKLWYNDDGEIEDVKCYRCQGSIALFNENGNLEPVLADSHTCSEAPTFPVKP